MLRRPRRAERRPGFGLLAVGSAAALFWGATVPARAEVRLPRVIGNNMVLQRDAPVPIWGWADAGEGVTVEFAGQRRTATADAAGKWSVTLEPMPADAANRALTVRSAGHARLITLDNILVGEVWLCAGQSNMLLPLSAASDGAQEVAKADYPNIRLVAVPQRPAAGPLPDTELKWTECRPATARDFSALAYFFGRELRRELDVPVGLICAAWGGTRIVPWTPPEGMARVPELADTLAERHALEKQYRGRLLETLPVVDKWLAATRKALAENTALPPIPDLDNPLSQHTVASALYNGMIAPLVPFAVRGAVWYQGEANRGDGMMYHHKMQALVGGWRAVWGRGDFPFYYVQLAPYDYGENPHLLPELWEAQTAALSIPNTGMAGTLDIGNLTNMHPPNKQEVGRRLALWALAKTYGRKDLVYSGPLYRSMRVEGGKAVVEFDHTGGGLTARDGKPLSHFQIAGEDKAFVEATAAAETNRVVVSSDAVVRPVAVRFAWDQKAQPNLMNKEGLPAAPFRTDRW